MAKSAFFLRLANLLEFLVLEPISRVPPCESSRPGDSENVVLFGRATFLTGVIAAQSQQTLKFCLRPRKYAVLQKKDTATILIIWPAIESA